MSETVEFTVEKSDGVKVVKIAVNDRTVTLTSHKGEIELETDTEHTLTWWFSGRSGDSLRIIGEITKSTGAKEIVVERDKSEIPAGETETAGFEPFDL